MVYDLYYTKYIIFGAQIYVVLCTIIYYHYIKLWKLLSVEMYWDKNCMYLNFIFNSINLYNVCICKFQYDIVYILKDFNRRSVLAELPQNPRLYETRVYFEHASLSK